MLQHQKVYRKLDDDISDVFSGLKISAESEETSAAVKNQFRLSFFGLKTPRLPNGFVCLLGARENLIEECKRAETTKKHADDQAARVCALLDICHKTEQRHCAQ